MLGQVVALEVYLELLPVLHQMRKPGLTHGTHGVDASGDSRLNLVRSSSSADFALYPARVSGMVENVIESLAVCLISKCLDFGSALRTALYELVLQ